METEIRKLRYYSKEFKLEAINQIIEKGRTCTEVALGLGIPVNTLYTWLKNYRLDKNSSFPGKGHIALKSEEMYKLRKQLLDVTEERDILKKAVAIFSKVPSRNINS